MWWIILIPILVMGFISFSRFQIKKYEKTELYEQHSQQLKGELVKRLNENGIETINKIIVNGHFTKSISHFWTSTSYYSFLIIFNPKNRKFDLYNYVPDESKIAFIGSFKSRQVRIRNIKDIYYTFIFFDKNGKKVQSVEAYKQIVPGSSEFQIQYPQEKEIELIINQIEGDTKI